MVPPLGIDPMTHRTMSERSYHGATSHSLSHIDSILASYEHHWATLNNGSTMRDWSDNPSHHECMLLLRSYISLYTKQQTPEMSKWKTFGTFHDWDLYAW